MSESTPPKYRVVERQLRARIDRLDDGALLPTETQMCREYGVSRITMRRAIDEVARDGLVTRHRGHGTKVNRPEPEPVDHRVEQGEHFDSTFTGFFGQLTGFGHHVHSDVLELRPVRANIAVARALGVEPHTEVLHMSRRRYVDGSVHQLSRTWFLIGQFPGIEDEDFSEQSLYGYLEKRHGVTIAKQNLSVAQVVPSRDDARLLGITDQRPRLSLSITALTSDGDSFLYGESIFVSHDAHIYFTATGQTPQGS
ncbi:GntR family transcriptional regulator [Kocuria massiliensis]|uniref:GntR family transcriptional regulator n=1 Tax=Kocuria massiliensis TaxID=1926282 RepID=UPI000A1C80B6|nr:GntR family transcriptional regulator [Kocuria massiliensis]MCT1367052.1 GntR family transcriptional regulator [Rothia sp. p3-SID1597]